MKKHEKKIRILNISYKYNWTEYNGRQTPENMKKIFSRGNTETFRANLIEKEIMEKNEKIVILTGDVHAFTKFKMPVFDYLSDEFCRFENRFMGNLLYKKYPDSICSIILHRPFSHKNDSAHKNIQPAKGYIEEIMMENNKKEIGFDLEGSELGKFSDESELSNGYDILTMEMIAEGYIFLKPLKELQGCSVDYDFIKGVKWEELQKTIDCEFFSRPNTIEEYWNKIEKNRDISKRYDI